jgi:hypothetical protein
MNPMIMAEIRYAARKDSLSTIKNILQENKVSDKYYNTILRAAINEGAINIVKFAITNLNFSINFEKNIPIRLAAKYGHTEVFKLLLDDPRVDPSDDFDYAIQAASKNGHCAILNYLLKDKRVDPLRENNWAIKNANQHKQLSSVLILWNDPRVKNTLRQDDFDLFNQLIKKDLKQKINEF